MENYHKYLPVSDDEKNWGLWVLNAGFTNIKPSVNYPFKDHPSHHFFNWAYGRTLQEYQIIYITRGEGTFESASCAEQKVEEGTIIFLFPGEWHRYKPNTNTGWDEHWIGVSGAVIDNLVEKGVFCRELPLLTIGFNEEVYNLLTEIIEKTKQERPGYQPQISGAALHLLGNIHAISNGNHLENLQYIELINKSKILFRANVRNDYSPEMAAEELMVSYSWFRKTFKNYTGMSPGQYFIDLKIQTAKELLSHPCYSIKCIASELQFSSVFHFSNMFKEKTGLSPLQYKNLSVNGNKILVEENQL